MIASPLARAFAILFAITAVFAAGEAIYFKASSVSPHLAVADRSAQRVTANARIERGPITATIAAAALSRPLPPFKLALRYREQSNPCRLQH